MDKSSLNGCTLTLGLFKLTERLKLWPRYLMMTEVHKGTTVLLGYTETCTRNEAVTK